MFGVRCKNFKGFYHFARILEYQQSFHSINRKDNKSNSKSKEFFRELMNNITAEDKWTTSERQYNI